MMDILIGVFITLVYLAFGVFIDALSRENENDFSIWTAILWPIPVGLVLFMIFVIVIPERLAKIIRNRTRKGTRK